jgi:hypothetical protein
MLPGCELVGRKPQVNIKLTCDTVFIDRLAIQHEAEQPGKLR